VTTGSRDRPVAAEVAAELQNAVEEMRDVGDGIGMPATLTSAEGTSPLVIAASSLAAP
jgi:hypothetical protein